MFVPSGGAAPAPRIDPEVLARQVVDSMRRGGPAVASARTAGTYPVGMPMWTIPSPSTFGPVTASATADGVTATATARVTTVRWTMSDGTTVTCAGPGTRYTPARGKSASPDCGHLYTRPAYDEPGGSHQGSATTTGTIEWAAPTLGDAGTLTGNRQTPFSVRAVEMQAFKDACLCSKIVLAQLGKRLRCRRPQGEWRHVTADRPRNGRRTSRHHDI